MTTPEITSEMIRHLPTPELGIAVLRILNDQGSFSVHNFFNNASSVYGDTEDGRFLRDRLSDAWAWLEAHGFIGRDPADAAGTWKRVTTDGKRIASDQNALARIWAADRLTGVLDPDLDAKVRPIFNVGDYETACFAAMKEVEVSVRRSAGLDRTLIGVKLMREAFKPEAGPLTDNAAPPGEQVATMELFAGAIGAFKNPPSHRTIAFDDPVEAAEIVQLADLLLRILRRTAKSS
jgi:uncharacterized protein (TIGR02391 family)